MSSVVRTAATTGLHTTPVATAIARSVRARRHGTGLPRARPICCLSRTAAETLLTIASDPRHLGARIGATAVLHTWGSAMTHHPHVHMIVPGGGISLDGSRWISCRPGFLLPVRVLSRLFRRLFLTGLADAHAVGRLAFFGEIDGLRDRRAFAAHLAPLRRKNWFVYAKPLFA